MRWVFVGVVALNLLYLGWNFLGADPADAPEPAAEAPEARTFPSALVLLSERSGAAPAPVGATAPALPVTGCPAVGPFGKEDAEAVREALVAGGYPAGEVVVERGATPVFWVYIPAFPSKQQAMRKLRELHAKGIDSFIVTDGPDANAISLGSFTSRDSALGVQTRLQASGYGVEIREQVRNVRQSWVVLEDPAAQGFFEHVPRALQPAARLERQACPSR